MSIFLYVGQNGVDTESLSYLKGEIERLFVKEKKCRDELWINGIVKSSAMSSKSNPNFIGSEEVLLLIYLVMVTSLVSFEALIIFTMQDPTCIICRQYLFLSAVSCNCRLPSYVCLEVCLSYAIVLLIQLLTPCHLYALFQFLLPNLSEYYILAALLKQKNNFWWGISSYAVALAVLS